MFCKSNFLVGRELFSYSNFSASRLIKYFKKVLTLCLPKLVSISYQVKVPLVREAEISFSSMSLCSSGGAIIFHTGRGQSRWLKDGVHSPSHHQWCFSDHGQFKYQVVKVSPGGSLRRRGGELKEGQGGEGIDGMRGHGEGERVRRQGDKGYFILGFWAPTTCHHKKSDCNM